jgi:hypothetical protein
MGAESLKTLALRLAVLKCAPTGAGKGVYAPLSDSDSEGVAGNSFAASDFA